MHIARHLQVQLPLISLGRGTIFANPILWTRISVPDEDTGGAVILSRTSYAMGSLITVTKSGTEA